MRATTLALLLVLGCSRGAKDGAPVSEIENIAGIAVDMGALRARHSPPEVVIEVKRRRRPSGSSHCAHSPACILLLPLIVIDLAFPKKVDVLTVTEDGVVTYRGWFSLDGNFINATSYDSVAAHNYQLLPLKALGRDLVIEQATAPMVDGEAGDFVPVAILPQVDLLSDYQNAMAKQQNDAARGTLAREALTVLQAEGEPLIRAHIGMQEPSDHVRAVVLSEACKGYRWATTELVAPAQVSPGVELGQVALSCSLLKDSKARPDFHRAVLQGVCDGAATESGLMGSLRVHGGLTAGEASTLVGECESPVQRAVLDLALGFEAKESDLIALLQGGEEVASGGTVDQLLSGGLNHRGGDFITAWIQPKCPAHRAALLQGLLKHPQDRDYMLRLVEPEVDPTGVEAATLARILVKQPDGMLQTRANASQVIAELWRARQVGADTTDAVAVLEAAHAEDKKNKFILAGLVVLGELQHSPGMLRSLSAPPSMETAPSSTTHPVSLTLALNGCTEDEQRDASKNAILKRSKAVPACLKGGPVSRRARRDLDPEACISSYEPVY